MGAAEAGSVEPTCATMCSVYMATCSRTRASGSFAMTPVAMVTSDVPRYQHTASNALGGKVKWEAGGGHR